jgi:imidazolonepropionase-like amidohydrolase
MNGTPRGNRLSTLAVLVLLIGTSRTIPAEQPSSQRGASVSPDASITIANVTVVDVATGTHQTGMTVVTRERDIVAIGQSVSVPPAGARMDGTGKFLIPGLWDMHSHHQGTGAASVDLFVANGVVGTRDMGADVDFILPLRDRINRGELLGPEILATGPILDDRPSHWPFRRRVRNGEEGREAVRDLKARGVDFIKVHDGTPREAFFAIADEAKKVGLPLVGHVPDDVKVEEAVAAGMKSIEHFANYRVLNQCSTNPPHNQISCEELFGMISSRGVWQTPTITFFQLIPDMFSGKPLPHSEYASDALLELTRENVRVSHLDAEALSFFRRNNRTSLAAIRTLFSRGVGFLAGCDGLVPGFCLHDELAWMTKAGLSPLQALQTATLNPARFLGRESTQGTVAAGQRADLVLLEADPLVDIANTRKIAAVVLRGRLLARSDLERIIVAHRRAASEP